MSLNSLPIRSAGNARRPSQHTTPQPSSSHVDLAVSPEPNLSLVGDAGDDSHASPSIEADPEHDPEQEHDPEDGAVVAPLYPEHFRLDTAAAAAATAVASSGSSSNHQFWLKDAKIAEDLFTVSSVIPRVESRRVSFPFDQNSQVDPSFPRSTAAPSTSRSLYVHVEEKSPLPRCLRGSLF